MEAGKDTGFNVQSATEGYIREGTGKDAGFNAQSATGGYIREGTWETRAQSPKY